MATQRQFVIEPRIKPLVDALNATGLVKTYSSCEGHFGETDRRERAGVGFYLAEGVTEQRLERFFVRLLRMHDKSETKWTATLDVYKHYLPNNEVEGQLATDYVFRIEPFPVKGGLTFVDRENKPNDREKRIAVDKLIAELCEQVPIAAADA